MYNEQSAIALSKHDPQLIKHQDQVDSHTIVFANGSSATTCNTLSITKGYRAAVFPDQHCPNNLLPEKALSDLGCTTTFYQDTCTITPPSSSNSKSIILIRNPETQLFHTSLQEIHTFMKDLEEEVYDAHRVNPPCTTCHDAFSAVLRHGHQNTVEYQVIDLHEKMGHPPSEVMCTAVSGDDPAWTNTGLTAEQIRKVFSKYTCIPCAAAKRNLNPPADRSQDERKKWKPGECFSCDPAVKINPPGFDGCDCFFLFKDLATGYLLAVTTDSKKATAFTDAFTKVLQHFAHHKCVPAEILRTDSEAIFLSKEVKDFLTDRNMKLQTSAPDCHFQVSVERDMQTVFKAISTILNSQPYLRYDLWPLALQEYIERKNRTPNKRCYPQSPHQVITNTSTDLAREYSYKFGDVVIAGTADRLRNSKFDPKNEVGIYIGQEPGTINTHRILLPHNNKIRINGSVSKLDPTEEQLNKWIVTRRDAVLPAYDEIIDAHYDLLPVSQQQQSATDISQEFTPTSNDIVIKYFGEDIISSEFSAEEQRMLTDTKLLTLLEKFANIIARQQTKSTKGRKKLTSADKLIAPKDKDAISPGPNGEVSPHPHFTRSKVHQSNICLHNVHLLLPTQASFTHYHALSTIYSYAAKKKHKTIGQDTDTPTVKTAMLMKDHEDWKKAIQAEIRLLLNETLEKIDVRTLVEGTYTFIATTTQLKRKRNAQGEYDKHKARVCARGDMLAGLLLADETYSPTVSPLTFALILQLAVIFGMKRKTIDTVGAYLYQKYPTDKRILITRLSPEVAKICDLDPDQPYKIVRYLYGLPDAGKAYYEAYSSHLMQSGYKKSAFDPCLFYKISDEELTLIVIHVDDTFIFSTNESAINAFVNTLKSKFNITVNDDADSYLGVSFVADDKGNVKLQQPKLIQALLQQYLPQLQSPPTHITTQQYQQLLGTLMYLTKSRPDIQTSISFASTHAKNPTLEHYMELLKLVSYINRTQDYGLIIQRYNYAKGEPLQLICHVDASYLTHDDSKSHTGFTLSFGTVGTFHSKSSKQPLVSTSSTHAEARALYTLLQDIIYVISICDELEIPLQLPVLIYEDNYPVVQLTNNLAPKAKKCKHFLMLLNFIKEKIEEGIIDVRHIDTNDNIADILTKLLTGSPFYSKAGKLLGHETTQTSPQQATHRVKRSRSESDNENEF